MIRLLLLLLLIFFSVHVAMAETEPIRVSADHLEANNPAGWVSFQGNVVADDGGVVLRAEQMKLFVDQEDRSLLRIEAEGTVRMTQGPRVASSNSAIFFNRERKIVLTGNARFKDGENRVEGQEITVFLDEERTLVGGEGGRVNAVFRPTGEDR
ncbi:MAG: lipopolysaccharide transport periplasmic protein LptA [Desulfuromonadaceae bacterium]|nr:lipopolysaccharide transport periplasmic protein LptA [Desulfuromonadaceae bacterium]